MNLTEKCRNPAVFGNDGRHATSFEQCPVCMYLGCFYLANMNQNSSAGYHDLVHAGCISQLSGRLLYLQHVHVLKEGRYQRWYLGSSQHAPLVSWSFKWKQVVLVCALEPPCQSYHLGLMTPFAYQRALLEVHKSQISVPRWLMVGAVAENPWILFLK